MQSNFNLNWTSFQWTIDWKSVPETLTKHQKSNAEYNISSKTTSGLRKTSWGHLKRPHKTLQDAPKPPQASPKTLPGGLQDPPKHFKAFQEIPKWVQAVAKSWQNAPKRLPNDVHETRGHFQPNLKPIKNLAYIMLMISNTQRFLTEMHALPSKLNSKILRPQTLIF